MRGLLLTRTSRGILVLVLILSLASMALADSNCWCSQFVDLRDDIPTRGSSPFLSIAASVALTGAGLYVVDLFNPPNATWYRTGALIWGASNIASALTTLLLPTPRSVERAADGIVDSSLSGSLCAATLTDFAGRVSLQRFVSGGIDVASGLGQIFLLSPIGAFATGGFYDWVFLLTGGLDFVGGLLRVLFPTGFERDVRAARLDCGW